MKVIAKRIPSTFYRRIHHVLPILMVDLVVKRGNKFLLVKRKRKPEANVWYFPGGRVLKGEKLSRAALRLLKQETGLIGEKPKFLGIQENFYRLGNSYFAGFSSHGVSFVFLLTVKKNSSIKLDRQSSNFKWFESPRPTFRAYLKKYLRLSGFK